VTKQDHGHSHGDKKCTGDHGHSHGDSKTKTADHGHSHGDKTEDHGHSHDHHGHSHGDLNMQAALAHIIGDLIQGIGALIASVIIFFFPDYKIIDPILTLIFALIVLITTVPVLNGIFTELMEHSPINLDSFHDTIMKLPNVKNVHNLKG